MFGTVVGGPGRCRIEVGGWQFGYDDDEGQKRVLPAEEARAVGEPVRLDEYEWVFRSGFGRTYSLWRLWLWDRDMAMVLTFVALDLGSRMAERSSWDCRLSRQRLFLSSPSCCLLRTARCWGWYCKSCYTEERPRPSGLDMYIRSASDSRTGPAWPDSDQR